MAVDPDAYRQESLESWARAAPGWEDRREWLTGITRQVNAVLVDRADPQPGQTFLEIAAGPGDLGFDVAERVGDDGRVISTDFSPPMVEVARRRGAARGLANVDYRVLDAESIELGDDSVDGVVCRFGYMLMADPARALTETRRVLRAGGPLAFAVWTTPDRNPWAAVPAMTLVQRGHMPSPQPGGPGMFAMGDSARLRELVSGAGFDDLELEEITFEFEYADFDDVWESLLRLSPVASVLNALPDDEREATRAALMESSAPYRGEDGAYSVPAAAWAAVAR